MSAAINKVSGLSDCALDESKEGFTVNKVSGLPFALTMSADEVAATLGLTRQQLVRKHRSMTAKNGFPRPLPGGIWMWSRAAFEAWVRANGVQSVELDAVEPTATAANDPTVALVREQNASLRMRYGGAR